jgi:hypothetical protein
VAGQNGRVFYSPFANITARLMFSADGVVRRVKE